MRIGCGEVWSANIGGLMNTQPLYARAVQIRSAGSPGGFVYEDLVIAATDKGRVAAVDAITGAKVWETKVGYIHLGSCQDLPYYGVTGTPAVDRTTNSVYVADGRGRIDRLDLATGRISRRWTITKIPGQEHVWSALTVYLGHVYAEIASYCDHGSYHGQIVSVNTRSGALRRWFVTNNLGVNGGGIWSWAGISVDPARKALYTATGNSSGVTTVGYSERVVRLTPGLRVRSSNYPGLPGGDADFGATPLLYHAPGCPAQLAVGNKYGAFLVYDRSSISRGPVQRISLGGSGTGQTGLIGIGAYLPAQRLLYVSNPQSHGPYHPGMLAFKVSSHCRLALQWQASGPGNATSSPTVAGGVVYYGTGAGSRVIALDALTGKQLWESDPLQSVFAAPMVVNGAVFVELLRRPSARVQVGVAGGALPS